MLVFAMFGALAAASAGVYTSGSHAEGFLRRSIESMVEYGYFSVLKSRAPGQVFILMATDRTTYGTERHVMRHFQEVMKQPLTPVLATGLKQATAAMGKGKEEMQKVLEVGLERNDEYVTLFKQFVRLVNGAFFKGLPKELQRRFSDFFEIIAEAPVIVLSAVAEAPAALPCAGEVLIGKGVYLRESERLVEERGYVGLQYRWRKLGKWEFDLDQNTVIIDGIIYADA